MHSRASGSATSFSCTSPKPSGSPVWSRHSGGPADLADAGVAYRPTRGSWLTMAESERHIMSRQRLARRLLTDGSHPHARAADEKRCHGNRTTSEWRFTEPQARRTLPRFYPLAVTLTEH